MFPHQNALSSGLPTFITMPRISGSKAFDSATQGTIIYATDYQDRPFQEVGNQLGTSRQAVKQIQKRVHGKADKKNIHLLTAANFQRPRFKRPSKLDVRDRRRLIRYATKNKINRRKPWTQCASECEIQTSVIAINHAFEIQDYKRHPPKYKPFLIDEQKLKRLEFCIQMLERDSK